MEKSSLLGLSRVATNEDAINRDNGTTIIAQICKFLMICLVVWEIIRIFAA